MSLDFSVQVVQPTEVFSKNITHNVAAMWRMAGVYDALYNSEGEPCRKIEAILRVGINDMLNRPNEYKALNPSNGWGNYEGALAYLQAVYLACKENPEGIIRVSA